MKEETGGFIIGAFVGFLIALLLILNNVESHPVLIKRGIMQHNPTTGAVEWKTNCVNP